MHIEIIAIGNEILNGHTINSNASYLSYNLQENGYQSYCHIALPDNNSILLKEIKASFNRSDIVICCGGLGPTLDDLTKSVISKLFNLELVIDPRVKKNLKKLFPDYTATDSDALVFKDSIVLLNNVGTAPGFIIEKNSKSLVLLPGVPSELKPMFIENIIPYLKEKFPIRQNIYQKKIGIFQILETEIDIILKKIQNENPKLSIGIYPSLGYVMVSISKVLPINETISSEVDDIISMIKAAFPENIFEESIADDLHKTLVDKKLTVAFAESCTGGALSYAICKIPGASKYFHGSIVSYNNEVKISHLHVNKYTLNEYGAVSLEVVSKMLDGILSTTSVDYALATSGIAGPTGGTDKKPIGTVCIGWANKANQKEIHIFHFTGKREKVIEKSVNTALAMLLKKVKYDAYTFKK